MHRADFIAKAAGCQLILASIGSSGRILTPPPERGVHAASTPECQALLAGVKALWIADVEAA